MSNVSGGATFAIMTSLFQGLTSRGLTPHVAWRASFAIIPSVLTYIIVKRHDAEQTLSVHP